jgi:aminoglycoside phosphotransferase (APT) family kinase protein
MQTPVSPHQLTADWLSAVLGSQGWGPCRVQSFSTELLGGEQGMTGQLARLRIRYDDPRPELPATVIAKFSASDPAARALINELGHYEREVRFYDQLSSRTPVPTPRCYYGHHDAETGFAALVMEDLAHSHNGDSIAGCSVDEVARVLVALARLHATWWRADDLANADWLRLRSLTAPAAMAAAFSDFWPSFLRKLTIPVTRRIRETGEWIEQTLGTAGTTLFDTGPRTLTHNDVQADNLFFGKVDGGVIFIDWQMVTYARCVIDVAGWVRGPLEPEVRRAAESQLVRLYHNALVANGVHDYTFDECMADYQLATVLAPARLAGAVGLSDGLQAHAGALRCFLVSPTEPPGVGLKSWCRGRPSGRFRRVPQR